MNPFNVVYLNSHDTGRYIGPYGYAVPTPNLDELAREGVTFRQAFSAAPNCSPARAALLTGECAHSNGMTGLANRGYSLAHPERHIVGLLKRAGAYHCVLTGIQHVAGRNAHDAIALLGYDEVLGEPGAGYKRDGNAEFLAADYLGRAQAPFFLDVGFYETHRVGGTFNDAPEMLGDERYCQVPAALPDVPDVRRDMADYAVAAQRLDERVGVVLNALEANGWADNTIVLYTTDHGVAFPGMKCNLTDHGTAVALMMRGPTSGPHAELLRGGQVNDALVSQLDIYPTWCELLGLAQPDWVQGHSLLPALRDNTEINEVVFSELNYHSIYEPLRAARSKRWKYIRRGDDRHAPAAQNCDGSISKRLWLELGWRDQPSATEQLYDLMFDPHETNNVAEVPANHRALNEMRGHLNRWMRATKDPLLDGPVPHPPEASVTLAE